MGPIELERTFGDTLFAGNSVDIGYTYVDASKNIYGINKMSANSYEARISSELALFSDKKIIDDIAVDEMVLSDEKISALTNLVAPSATSLLSPSSVTIKTGQTTEKILAASILSNGTTADTVMNTFRSRQGTSNAGTSSRADLLAELGITCEILGKKRINKNTGGTFAVDDGEKGPFESTDRFVSKNIEPETGRDLDRANEVSLQILRVLSPVLLEESQSASLLEVASDSCKTVLNSMSVKEINDLPLSIKSALLPESSSTILSLSETNGDSACATTDNTGVSVAESSIPISDWLAGSISRIEVLSYGRDANENIVPQWKTLTSTRLDRAGDRSFRCRVTDYSNPALGLGQKSGWSVSIFNKEFIIEGSDISKKPTRQRQLIGQDMQKYLKKQNRIIRNMKSMKEINAK
jgi:hypothetical protein